SGPWAESVAYSSPYGYMVETMDHFEYRRHHSYGNSRRGETINYALRQEFTEVGFLAVAFVTGCGYIVVTAGILGYTILRFDQIVGRAPQPTAPPAPRRL